MHHKTTSLFFTVTFAGKNNFPKGKENVESHDYLRAESDIAPMNAGRHMFSFWRSTRRKLVLNIYYIGIIFVQSVLRNSVVNFTVFYNLMSLSVINKAKR